MVPFFNEHSSMSVCHATTSQDLLNLPACVNDRGRKTIQREGKKKSVVKEQFSQRLFFPH